MKTISEIVSYIFIFSILLGLMVSIAIQAHAQDAQAELPVKVGIAQCGSGEQIQENCERNSACCALIEPASGEVFAEWTPEEETREIYVPNDVIVE